MKKQIAVALALLIGAFSFAQKKELKAVEKAIKGNNFAEAKTILGQVESLMGSADGKLQDKYYFLLGKALFANGAGSDIDLDKAFESFGKVKTSYKDEISEVKLSMLNSILTKSNDALQKGDYAMSSKGFHKAYKLSTKDTVYLYYAASTAVNGQDFDTALGMYEELKELGFTGETIEYFAINKADGKEEVFSNEQMRDLSVKAGTHIKPETRKSDSKAAEIVKNIALIYINQGKNEEAMAAMKDARAANPDDLNLLLSEANVSYKMGDTDRFKELMQEATSKDPNNPELQYNLGVISYESGDMESAKIYYQKAVDLDPNYVNAQINMAALVLEEEKVIIEQMNNLGNTAADDRKYDELRAKRLEVYKSAIPYLKQALKTQPDNLQAGKTLMNIYSAIGETEKYKELKAKVDAIESGS